jgi:hypothetical protein
MGMVFAHQGGWDEMQFVALPLAVFAILLFLANRKAQAQLDAEQDDASAAEERDET